MVDSASEPRILRLLRAHQQLLRWMTGGPNVGPSEIPNECEHEWEAVPIPETSLQYDMCTACEQLRLAPWQPIRKSWVDRGT